MSLVDVDSWQTECDACERLHHDTLQQLNQREKRQRGSREYNRLTAAIRIGLGQYETELRQLKDRLLAARDPNEITVGECQRRQRQLESLQTKLLQLKTKCTESTKNDFMQSVDGASTSGRSPWDGDGDSSTSARPPSDVDALKQQQIDMLEDQNKGLEALQQSIQRQKRMATDLGREVEVQSELLDTMSNTMDRVESGVAQETTNIGTVTRKDSTWGLWTVIVLLFVAILLVIFI